MDADDKMEDHQRLVRNAQTCPSPGARAWLDPSQGEGARSLDPLALQVLEPDGGGFLGPPTSRGQLR